ncbi:NAD-dependent protein lipoamidase sirtuin-4, mitochondrial-like [Ruditapes philippinarum]|uniref:NAD-dependent protein lipoamidase sirtuin-4, mitochondrial-like n=1 Tax=Ruditapes philippinarum TaxID=129788 RepID=UPI00295B58A6|nr:NAD-dependent protein lipoamidase sirtuin-4, mitochondrial-like [Ruditapes philippinarum]XP_060552372.1 NAD-dependent protein lipoamidase sirtuin-4, mitochondrial-like [Ruditapes philippinarum]
MARLSKNVLINLRLMKNKDFTSFFNDMHLSYSKLVVIRGLASRSGSNIHSSRFCSTSSVGTSSTPEIIPDSEKEEKEHDLALFPNPSDLNKFVPHCEPVRNEDVRRLQEFVNHSKRLLILTGAGISTESGIPDYRSEGVGLYARSTNRPVQYQDFVKDPNIRQRYWARNYVGWPKFGFFLPNKSHVALAEWERKGKVHWLVTQNVDALHYKAGSKNVTELHGSAHRVMCLGCDHKMTRPEMQVLIESYNPNWSAQSDEIAPDADVQLTQDQIDGFKVPPCPSCGGPLKPEITFFGDNVLKPIVEFVHDKVKESDSLLFVGTSLQVYSGYRFAAAAKDQGKPMAILNIGPTRADKLAHLQIHGKCGDILPKIQIWR